MDKLWYLDLVNLPMRWMSTRRIFGSILEGHVGDWRTDIVVFGLFFTTLACIINFTGKACLGLGSNNISEFIALFYLLKFAIERGIT